MIFELAWSLAATTTRPWRKMFWFALDLYFTALSILLTLFLRVMSSPFRLLDAARREKLLEAQLQELQMRYDELSDKNSELERRLENATTDRKRIKESLGQAVAEWEKSIGRLKQLKSRVQELENQNSKLRELEGRTKLKLAMATKKQAQGNTKKQHQKQGLLGDGNSLLERLPLVDDSLLMEGRGVALASSIFSAVLSLLVGLIAYEAEDPCVPLVIALFTVVVMSLANVAQFFSKLQSRHGFDAVALLSFNWFMLGTLAFPAFPIIAKFFLPLTLQTGSWVASWFGVR